MAGGRPEIEPGALPYSNVLPMWTNGLGEIHLPNTSLNFSSNASNILILIAGFSLWSME